MPLRANTAPIGTVPLFDVTINDAQLGIVDYPVGSLNPGETRQLGQGEIAELIIATNPTVEGDTTALYLARLLKPLGVTVSRLASGLPI